MKTRVAVGMSGGVDSSVAAALLVEQGYEVTGVFIEAYNESGCRTDEDKRDALKVATKLGIRFQILDLRKEYKEKVVKYFEDEYRVGRTPNPDVVCNREVKFGLFYDWALKQNFDYVSTGHYARICDGKLQRPKDLSKDQTYWLWQVAPEKLQNIIFPLGELTKKAVRMKATELQLPNADKPDSMGVCMMGELNVREWLQKRLGEQSGEVVWKGQVVGSHRGLWFATEGQRVGAGIEYQVSSIKQMGMDMTRMPPLYVIRKDKETNQLIVGERGECNTKQFSIGNLQFSIEEDLIRELTERGKLYVRIRNLGELVAVSQWQGDTVSLTEPIFAPAEGQSAVFYLRENEGEEWVVGGGIIGSCN